jgi:hypothetical protein
MWLLSTRFRSWVCEMLISVYQVFRGFEAHGDDCDGYDTHAHGRQVLLRHPPRSSLRSRKGPPLKAVIDTDG